MASINVKMDSVLELTGGGAGAFANANWRFEKGQQWVVTGPNGSGKSYLASILAGELPPRGLSLEMAEGVEERVAMMTFAQQREQASAGWLQARWHCLDGDAAPVSRFLSFESVFDINPHEVRGDDAPERRAFAKRLARLSRPFRIRELMDRAVLQLSNGEMRRVLFVRALLKAPALLVLDDPFSGLDPSMRELLKSALDALAAGGLPMAMMLRNDDEIPSCATHLLKLDALRIVSARPLAKRRGEAPQRKAAPTAPPRPPATTPPVIEFRGLTVRYGRRTLFDRFSWTVRRGERWLVCGPNGAGKTTLLSYITGDNPQAYAADVRVFGERREPGRSLWETRSRIGQVSPEIQCYFKSSLNALDAVFAGICDRNGKAAAITRARRAKAAKALAEFGIKDAAAKTFAALSAGEQRIVLLVRALLPEPDLLLLDEPCLNLDGAMRRRVLGAVERALRTHPEMTAVCITHRPENLPKGFGRVLDLGAQNAE